MHGRGTYTWVDGVKYEVGLNHFSPLYHKDIILSSSSYSHRGSLCPMCPRVMVSIPGWTAALTRGKSSMASAMVWVPTAVPVPQWSTEVNGTMATDMEK